MPTSFKIKITGQVQGVGFRPFVYGLAQEFGVRGTVSNNAEGVIIYASGPEKDIRSFYRNIIERSPRVAKINNPIFEKIDFRKFDRFQIVPSEKSGKLNLQLTPDFAICDVCKNEVSDRNNRRYHYPFTTCVHCGPRWAITQTFPFERNHTAMAQFAMCDDCKKEYIDPTNRRFHSQTNSCTKCGVSLFLTNAQGNVIDVPPALVFKKVAELILAGNIIAIKNTAGYLLCCDAANKTVVQQLRDKKHRPQKPFAILYPSLSLLKQHLKINPEQENALTSAERPIVILPKTDFKGALALTELAPHLNQLGVMLPYSGMLHLLAEEINVPIVATSGNIHGSPIIGSKEMAHTELKNVADYFLHHDLEIIHPQDDSVVKFSTKFNQKVIFRRSRGYAPNFHGTAVGTPKRAIAMGAHLKSTIAFLPNDFLYIGQYLGNLDHYEVYERFVGTVTKFIDLFEQKPDVVLVDRHPAYLSTQYGKELSKQVRAKLYQIQHHKAHFASVLGEHELFNTKNPVLGVIWDGTGYGDDGQIWGGEFFKYHSDCLERLAHFDYFDWLAGDKMAKEPKLSLFSLSNDELNSKVAEKFSGKEIKVYQALKKRNTLKTSSVGRLFDAVASVLNICDHNTYEGEAAILLENHITDYELQQCRSYCTLLDNGNIPTQLLFSNLYKDVKNGTDNKVIIANFLYTLATLVFQVADRQNIRHIAFSGGVFQNTVLMDMLKEQSKNSYTLYFNRNLSPNDENISFGQLMYYLYVKGIKPQGSQVLGTGP